MNKRTLAFAGIVAVALVGVGLFAATQSPDRIEPASGSAAPQQQARPGNTDELRPMPVPEKLTQDQFIAATKDVHLSYPDQDQFLDIKMRLPQSWAPRADFQLKNLAASERLFGELAWYDAPGEASTRPFVTIKSVAMDYELTAKSWITMRVFDNAYTLRSLRERSFDDVEAVYVTYDQLVTYITWARAKIVGQRVVLVEYNLPSDMWARDKDMQARAMASVEIADKDMARIEPLAAFAFLDVATFQYPKSWTLLRNIIRSPDFFRVALFNAQGKDTPTVQITVQAARIGGAVTLDEMKAEEQKFLDRQRVTLRDSLPVPNFIEDSSEIKSLKNTAFTVSSNLGLYETNFKEKPVLKEYWTTTFDKDGTAFVITMLVPNRHNMYADWARATRTYQIILQTLAQGRIGTKPTGTTGQQDGDTAIPFLDK